MYNFQDKKSDFKRLLESWPSLVFGFFLLIFFAVNIFVFFNKMEEANNSKKIAQQKLNELTANKDRLNTEINNLNTEKGKEELIREKFGLAKEGEDMIVIVSDKNGENIKIQEEEPKTNFLSFFNKFFR